MGASWLRFGNSDSREVNMTTKKSQTKNGTAEAVAVVGGAALIGSILGNLGQYGKNKELCSQIEALQRLVADWRTASQSLEGQLTLALQANASLNEQATTLRNDLRSTQGRVYMAEQRALTAEARLREVEAEMVAHRESKSPVAAKSAAGENPGAKGEWP